MSKNDAATPEKIEAQPAEYRPHKAKVRDRYDALVHRYIRHYTNPKSLLSLEKRRRAQILERYIASTKPPTVLDIGCGPGYVAFEVAKALSQARIFGVDLSGLMIDYANTHYSGRVAFAMGDIECLSFASEQFSFVYALGVLEKLESLDRLFSEVQRVLRLHGEFFFTYPNKYSVSMRVRRAGYHLRNRGPAYSIQHWLDAKELATLLQRTGFEIKRKCHITYGNSLITLPWTRTLSKGVEKLLGHCELGQALAMSTIWIVSKSCQE